MLKSINPYENLLINEYQPYSNEKVKNIRIRNQCFYEFDSAYKNRIILTDNAHLELELEGEKTSRKWEALARYENKGFLIATDKYPTTILAYVPLD